MNEISSTGVTFARAFADAATLAALSSAGSNIVSAPGDWSITSAPAAATQATISKAAAAAGIRHIATSVSGAVSAGATAQAAALVIVIRDGATGAGTILWSKQVILPVNGVFNFDLSPLNIVGSAATAMTVETTAAPAAGVFASVSLTGHEAQ